MRRSGLLPYKLHIRTSCSTVEGYLQAVTSRQDVTCRSCRGQGASRHVTSCQDVTGAAGGRHVTSRHVTWTSQARPWTRRPSRPSRHVRTSQASRQEMRRRRGQGGRRVTSRRVRTPGTAVDKEAVTSRHVTSRCDNISASRHVTSCSFRHMFFWITN